MESEACGRAIRPNHEHCLYCGGVDAIHGDYAQHGTPAPDLPARRGAKAVDMPIYPATRAPGCSTRPPSVRPSL
jgi:hypothetical protein